MIVLTAYLMILYQFTFCNDIFFATEWGVYTGADPGSATGVCHQTPIYTECYTGFFPFNLLIMVGSGGSEQINKRT